MGKKIKIQIRKEHLGSNFRELKNNFWVKILKLFYADGCGSGSGNLFDPGSGKNREKTEDRDKRWVADSSQIVLAERNSSVRLFFLQFQHI